MLVILDLGLSRLDSVPHYLVWWGRGVAGKAIWSQQRLANELRGQRLEGLAASVWLGCGVHSLAQVYLQQPSKPWMCLFLSTRFSFTYFALLKYFVFWGFVVVVCFALFFVVVGV